MTHNNNINNKLHFVIKQAEALNIPISKNILEPIVINKRAKTRFGCCKILKKGYIIEVSELIANGPEHYLLEIIAHEILHTCPGCNNHSKYWKDYAFKMNNAYGYNIKRTSLPKELGISENIQDRKEVKYIIKCKSCGQKIERRRKSKLLKNINRYRCACGGKLELQE